MTPQKLFPLGKLKQIVEAIGMDISYAHEDLVFLEHNAFLLQFTDSEDRVIVHPNVEGEEGRIADDLARLQQAATQSGMLFNEGCRYRLSELDEENIQLEFLE